jgi:GNAT superfamily N-acetyltransferase
VNDPDQAGIFRTAWAESDADILACLPILRELRPYIGWQGDFLERVRRLEQHGYRLVAAWEGDQIVACAGYQIEENLIRGRYLHVPELVTTQNARSHGIGQRLLQVLIQEARDQDCRALILECGLPNPRAHAFYFREGLRITAFRFAIGFDAVPSGEE